jgi:hypothetical protein
MKKRRDPLYSNPIAQSVVRANVRQSLERIKTDSELQAYAGANVGQMVSDACMLLYSVAWAHKVKGLDNQSPDARIMRGMANALADLAQHPNQIEIHRPAVQAGIMAIERVLPDLEPLAIGVGMVDCKNLISSRGITAEDIHSMLR